MDKQEIMEKLNREIAELKKTEASCFRLGSKTEEMKFTNRIMGLQVALNWVRQLDEPQEVKVPKCLAAYIDYSKSRGGDSVEEIFSPAWVSENDEVYNWLYDNSEDENDRRYLLAVRAYVEGDYEVEEEPKWVVKQKTFYFQKFSGFKFGVNCHEAKSEAALFTEKKKAEAVAVLIDGTVEKV